MALLNLIWFIFGGEIVALIWLLLGIIFSITIIGFPIGKACFQLAKLSAFPFGKEIIKETELKGSGNVSMIRKVGGVILNIIWFPIGLFLAAVYVCLAIASFCTIIGIPVGVVQLKVARFAIMPIGAKCVSKKQAYASAVANELEKRQSK
ncbi:MAG: hypothetical protein HDR32_01080 [Treponema sp.]|nr:hypothetical protein [Treponema sp.]